ncbi:MAG TPA: ATP-binding protein [Dehalococcoidia bacterium]|nr:ATP-binding protein [Dehalococcoidia bacterium]
MELIDELKSQLNKCRRLAKKYYDQGELAKSSAEYLKCSELTKHLAELSPPKKRAELLSRSERFREIADEILRNPPQPPREKEKLEEKRENLIISEKPGTRFSDIAGLDGVKEKILEAIVYPFKYPEEYEHFGVKPGGGILLYGPPGCGKTMIAAAAAGECDAVFINLKVSDIKDKYVGESERKIREVFDAARSYDRAIIFFDEIDALAGERSSSREGHERSLVSELLAQMDGLEAKDSVRKHLVLAATNRPWDIDLALRRPGRFDVTVFVPHPDLAARKRILEINLKNKPVSPKVDLDELALKLDGFASAEIVAVCDEAAKIPLRERIKDRTPRRQLVMDDFNKACDKQQTILRSWYAKASETLPQLGETEMFQDLIKAAREYKK